MNVFTVSIDRTLEIRSFARVIHKHVPPGTEYREEELEDYGRYGKMSPRFYLPVGDLEFEVPWNLRCGPRDFNHLHWVTLTTEQAYTVDFMQPAPDNPYYNGSFDYLVLLESQFPCEVVEIVGQGADAVFDTVLARSNGTILLHVRGQRFRIETQLPNSQTVTTDLWQGVRDESGAALERRHLFAMTNGKTLALAETHHTDCKPDLYRLTQKNPDVTEQEVYDQLVQQMVSPNATPGMTAVSTVLIEDSDSPDTLVAAAEDFLREQ